MPARNEDRLEEGADRVKELEQELARLTFAEVHIRLDSLQLTCFEGRRSSSTADFAVWQEVLRLRDGDNKGQTGVEVMSITRSTLHQGHQIGILAYK